METFLIGFVVYLLVGIWLTGFDIEGVLSNFPAGLQDPKTKMDMFKRGVVFVLVVVSWVLILFWLCFMVFFLVPLLGAVDKAREMDREDENAKVTVGPQGRNVILGSTSTVTKDGVPVHKEI